MGFWNFLRDMFVIDWLFGQHKKKSLREHSPINSPQEDNYLHEATDYHSADYSYYGQNDYVHQDFDDDLDSGVFDDDLDSGVFDDDLDSGVFDDDF